VTNPRRIAGQSHKTMLRPSPEPLPTSLVVKKRVSKARPQHFGGIPRPVVSHGQLSAITYARTCAGRQVAGAHRRNVAYCPSSFAASTPARGQR